jgi:hypothetical protein
MHNVYTVAVRTRRPTMEKRITVNFEGDDVEVVEDVKDEADIDAWSEAVRECVRRYADLKTERDELQTEVARLKNEKRTVLAEREEKQELQRYVEDEMTARERARRASIVERARWFVFGQQD